jgi:HTH-type transcriptional regulator/antitoxin HigA
MEQGGLTVKDLVPSIGRPNRVYEVLNGKRSLTVDMIRSLHRNLGIPAESLIGP